MIYRQEKPSWCKNQEGIFMPLYLFIRIPKFDIQVVLLTLYSTLELNNVLNVSFKSETLSLPITKIRCTLF